MHWLLHPGPPPDGGGDGTYQVDVTIDDIRFIPF
jgi:hypothetical protein